jgi:hypothetical protein
LVPGAAPLAICRREDVLAQLPKTLLKSDVRPITDALADSLLAILLECQYRGSYAAAQSDVARAVGRYLAELGAERQFSQATGELAADYRARILEIEQGSTLVAIRAAVNAILAPHTESTCQVIEPALDRWFVGVEGSGAVWHGCVGAGISPSYPTRLYPSEVDRNGGESLPYSEPLGARVFGDHQGRLFMVIVPRLEGLGSDSCVWDYTGERPDWGLFCSSEGGGMPGELRGFVREESTTAIAVYRAIENAVHTLAGHSCRWSMLTSEYL